MPITSMIFLSASVALQMFAIVRDEVSASKSFGTISMYPAAFLATLIVVSDRISITISLVAAIASAIRSSVFRLSQFAYDLARRFHSNLSRYVSIVDSVKPMPLSRSTRRNSDVFLTES